MEIIGDVESYQVKDGFLHLSTQQAQLRLGIYNASTFRVQACKIEENFQENSYACPDLSLPIDFTFAEREGSLVVTTDALIAHIALKPFRMRFETPDGKLISEDDAGLGIAWDGHEVTNYRKLQPGERFFGLGEKSGPLDKAGKQYRNWNTDAFGYGPSTDPLYVTCPFFMGLSHGQPYGIFLNNHHETVFNFGAANDRFSFFQAASGQLDYFFFAGPQPADVLRDYTALTGRVDLPPLWSLGFQQCRYSYYPDAELLRVARTFRELHIPIDVIYFDIHYMQDFKVFTWHNIHFPNPESLIVTLKDMGFRVVVILDPGIKVEDGYEVYDDGMSNDVFVKYPDGVPYRGAAWPGWCHFPDFTDPKVRNWWGTYVGRLVGLGVDGFWNDMNEPAVWGHFTPNAVQFSLEGKKGSHKEAHNVYGMQMARATAEGADSALGSTRSFILTRATYAGGQRHSALWTGDNFANDAHLLLGARMVSGMGLSGFPFSGNDVGGFTGEASAALYMRWVACATFHPLMRAHTMINSRHAEPWSFGEECTEVARNYLRLRYMLLPHLYALFFESTLSGMPPVRALLFRFYKEWKVFSKEFENQFLLGSHLMICPVEAEARFAKVYLPEGNWFNFFNDRLYQGGTEHLVELQRDIIPVFVQAGGIIPTKMGTVNNSADPGEERMGLHVYLGAEGHYHYYEDDGLTRGGDSCKRHIDLGLETLTIGAAEGDFKSVFKSIRIFFHGFQGHSLTVNGNMAKVGQIDFRFLDAISNFDPYESYPDGPKLIEQLRFVDIAAWADEVKITF